MKKVTILGSAAAEGIPAMFCNCRVCVEAWKNGGKDIRMRTAYKFNEHVRVDFGPDTLAQEFKYQLHSENLRHLFITHSHEDHFYSWLLNYRMPGFSVVPEGNLLNIYGNPGVMDAMNVHFAKHRCDYGKFRLNPVLITAFEPVELPEEDMTFYPMHANHMPTEKPMIYAIRYEDKWVLIANDTGVNTTTKNGLNCWKVCGRIVTVSGIAIYLIPRAANAATVTMLAIVLPLLVVDCAIANPPYTAITNNVKLITSKPIRSNPVTWLAV